MKRSAFTLIELLVVIAIIAILAAILFPVFARAKASAKNIKEVVQAREIGMAVSMYLVDYDDRMPLFYAYNSDPPAGVEGQSCRSTIHRGQQQYVANKLHFYNYRTIRGGTIAEFPYPRNYPF